MGAKQMKCLSSSSPTHSPKEEHIIAKSEELGELVGNHTDQPKSLTEDAVKSSATEPSPGPDHAVKEESSTWEEQLCAQQEQLEKEMQETRKMVSRLQALLLHGSLPEDEQTSTMSFGDSAINSEQQLILIRSRLDQSMEETLDLKRELLRYKQEARNLQAVKDALQQRMSVQEDSVLQIKQELLRSTMAREELEGQNEELERKLNDRNRMLNEYKKELGQKDRLLQQQQVKLDDTLRRMNESNYHRLSSYENNGYSHMMDTSSSIFQHRMGDELQLVRDALRSLRDSFSGHDPQHHTLDTLEQGVASLVDRLHTTESKKRQERKGSTKSPGRKANHTDRESWPSSKMAHSHSSPVLSAVASTKVLYYTDRSLTPFLVNIPKRLGEVTLQDFKAAVDRHGSFRYHFKSLDPEFGTVKEEVFQDDALIPGWEGKIVAWVEEDHGESR
ncbi:dixin-A isoform X1 [Xyrauchen texanus]|uniref:dixin-A isoform X1 n=1 Tax=Xyrauchen texanus TaxID=154827 RepID=UPI0022422A95|nr:dixin-A isoform X1 [Xyrauchen texanus]